MIFYIYIIMKIKRLNDKMDGGWGMGGNWKKYDKWTIIFTLWFSRAASMEWYMRAQKFMKFFKEYKFSCYGIKDLFRNSYISFDTFSDVRRRRVYTSAQQSVSILAYMIYKIYLLLKLQFQTYVIINKGKVFFLENR